MKFQLEYKDGYFVGKTFGEATAKGFCDLLDAMLQHEHWQPGTSWFQDNSQVIADQLSTEGIKTIARYCSQKREEIGSGRCAVVVSEDLHYGITRMWHAYVDDSWDMESKVCRTCEEALEWLGVG